MKTIMINDSHKITIKRNDNGFTVAFYENMGGRWVKLPPEETWSNMEDIKCEYGIK